MLSSPWGWCPGAAGVPETPLPHRRAALSTGTGSWSRAPQGDRAKKLHRVTGARLTGASCLLTPAPRSTPEDLLPEGPSYIPNTPAQPDGPRGAEGGQTRPCQQPTWEERGFLGPTSEDTRKSPVSQESLLPPAMCDPPSLGAQGPLHTVRGRPRVALGSPKIYQSTSTQRSDMLNGTPRFTSHEWHPKIYQSMNAL